MDADGYIYTCTVYSIQPLSALHARRFGCGEKADGGEGGECLWGGGGGCTWEERGLWLLGNFVHSTCIDEFRSCVVWSWIAHNGYFAYHMIDLQPYFYFSSFP